MTTVTATRERLSSAAITFNFRMVTRHDQFYVETCTQGPEVSLRTKITGLLHSHTWR